MRNNFLIYYIFISLLLSISNSISNLQTQSFSKNSKIPFLFKEDNKGYVRFITGVLSQDNNSDIINATYTFINDNFDLFSIGNTKSQLKVINEKFDRFNCKHLRLQQIYNSIPVFGRFFTSHLNSNNELSSIENDFI